MQLKSAVHWIEHPEGYWILRNPEHLTFLQVDELDRRVISLLGKVPLKAIALKYNLSPEDIQQLLQMLAATGMLEGTEPPKKKFSLAQILYLKIPLIKPDRWLTRHAGKLRWIWTKETAIILSFFLISTIFLWLVYATDIATAHQEIWVDAKGDTTKFLKLGILTILVIFFHELGHAFTLKNYGGIVPEIGLLLMCFIPNCYTNTTDQYSLVKRRQRVLVVAAGVTVQIVIWAIAVWVLLLSEGQNALQEFSYLLMTASLLTLILNLNPLNKFDGYFLLVAMTGINNLRERSLKYYLNLFRRQPINETPGDKIVLALYGPLSIIYTIFVFGYLLSLIGTFIGERVLPLFFSILAIPLNPP